jgi:uncharacterized damage-inducible protein DinB
MPITDTLLLEFDQEMATTRSLIERVPADAVTWKPHPKSMALGQLAIHIVNLVRYTEAATQLPELDFAGPAGAKYADPKFTSTEELVSIFDKNVAMARSMISALAEQDLRDKWSLRVGPRTIFTLPRAGVLRSFIMNHVIHHRGQLSVYLRLRDVPLPPIYGPTADS